MYYTLERKDYEYFEMKDLVGKTLQNITTTMDPDGNDMIIMQADNNELYVMYRLDNSGGRVKLEEMDGNFTNLIGAEIIEASERTEESGDYGNYYHTTWTFYILSTYLGTVHMRWYGHSNGYYSEQVDLLHFKDPNKLYEALKEVDRKNRG